MSHLYLGVEVGDRPNGPRVARLLREIQSACTVERRRALSKPFKGRERRLSGQVQVPATK